MFLLRCTETEWTMRFFIRFPSVKATIDEAKILLTQHGVPHQCSRAITNNTKKQQCRHKCCCSHNICFNFRFITLVLACFDHMVNQDLIPINFLKLHIPVYKSFGTPSTIFSTLLSRYFSSLLQCYIPVDIQVLVVHWIRKRQFERRQKNIWPFFSCGWT